MIQKLNLQRQLLMKHVHQILALITSFFASSSSSLSSSASTFLFAYLIRFFCFLILDQPMLTSFKASKLIKSKEGQSVNIDCLLTENFKLYSQAFDIEWLKDGRPINFGSRIKLINQSKLKITSVIRDDRGMYQCIIKRDDHNRKETFFATFQLYIQGLIYCRFFKSCLNNYGQVTFNFLV